MPVLRNKKTGPGMMPGRLAACSLRGRKRGLLKLDDGVQAVPGHACGQRDFVLGAFLFKLGGFSVSTAVHDDGRFCEFLADVLDEERFGAFQLFSLLSNQRADMQVDGLFAAPVRLVAAAAPGLVLVGTSAGVVNGFPVGGDPLAHGQEGFSLFRVERAQRRGSDVVK